MSVSSPAAVTGSLSPSRASDFLSCPLKYRLRVIDRLPEPTSAAAVRGTLIHAVLEELFDAPPEDRTVALAHALLSPRWRALRDREPEWATLFDDEAAEQDWLRGAAELLTGYFDLEDPARLAPAAREEHVEAVLADGLRLHGIVDRLDVSPAGELRVVDYKTGASPREGFETAALFQLRFYALVLWRSRGELPRMLQLVYLKDRQLLRFVPTEAELLATERKLVAVWAAVARATRERDFRPRRSRLCDWCAHQALCPAFGGQPPAWPGSEAAVARLDGASLTAETSRAHVSGAWQEASGPPVER